MIISYRLAAWTAVVSSVGCVLGCGKSEPTTPVVPVVASSGNAVFDQNCAKCHSVGNAAASGPGPQGKMGGPSLSKVGADPAHTKAWLAEHVNNPKAHKPDSKMPAFDGKLKPEEMTSVLEFMSGLK
ncbi:MAG: petJ [Gemmataceae bacterium]|nr:petJ [Gemmataceae bacterium]